MPATHPHNNSAFDRLVTQAANLIYALGSTVANPRVGSSDSHNGPRVVLGPLSLSCGCPFCKGPSDESVVTVTGAVVATGVDSVSESEFDELSGLSSSSGTKSDELVPLSSSELGGTELLLSGDVDVIVVGAGVLVLGAFTEVPLQAAHKMAMARIKNRIKRMVMPARRRSEFI